MAKESGFDLDSENFASFADNDIRSQGLPDHRQQFLFPATPDTAQLRKPGSKSIYFCGNSLGLQPKHLRNVIGEELDKWGERGVDGHFAGARPWVTMDEINQESMAKIVGAKTEEVALMNTLSTNLHIMMASFYRPTPKRHKILVEAKAFPSDKFVVDSQARFHGYDPETAIIEIHPRPGANTIAQADIEEVLEAQGDEIALVMLSGIQYYSGQLFDIAAITKAAKAKGCNVGWDLAHAVGNVPLQLHDSEADFACWCTYKYLNSGPGNIAGCFVSEKHFDDMTLPRLNGWWSHRKQDRFDMEHNLILTRGALSWQHSNPSVLGLCALRASLDIFDLTGMDELRTKSLLLTRYLERLLSENLPDQVKVFSPADPSCRGSQLSLVFSSDMEQVHNRISAEGIICDLRKPSVMRIAPAPLYNNFADVHDFVRVLRHCL